MTRMDGVACANTTTFCGIVTDRSVGNISLAIIVQCPVLYKEFSISHSRASNLSDIGTSISPRPLLKNCDSQSWLSGLVQVQATSKHPLPSIYSPKRGQELPSDREKTCLQIANICFFRSCALADSVTDFPAFCQKLTMTVFGIEFVSRAGQAKKAVTILTLALLLSVAHASSEHFEYSETIPDILLTAAVDGVVDAVLDVTSPIPSQAAVPTEEFLLDASPDPYATSIDSYLETEPNLTTVVEDMPTHYKANATPASLPDDLYRSGESPSPIAITRGSYSLISSQSPTALPDSIFIEKAEPRLIATPIVTPRAVAEPAGYNHTPTEGALTTDYIHSLQGPRAKDPTPLWNAP